MPDQHDAASDLSADQLEEISGMTWANEQDLGRIVVRIDLLDQLRHVERVRDRLDRRSMLQRGGMDPKRHNRSVIRNSRSRGPDD